MLLLCGPPGWKAGFCGVTAASSTPIFISSSGKDAVGQVPGVPSSLQEWQSLAYENTLALFSCSAFCREGQGHLRRFPSLGGPNLETISSAKWLSTEQWAWRLSLETLATRGLRHPAFLAMLWLSGAGS